MVKLMKTQLIFKLWRKNPLNQMLVNGFGTTAVNGIDGIGYAVITAQGVPVRIK